MRQWKTDRIAVFQWRGASAVAGSDSGRSYSGGSHPVEGMVAAHRHKSDGGRGRQNGIGVMRGKRRHTRTRPGGRDRDAR
jgi:hypothetical protein